MPADIAGTINRRGENTVWKGEMPELSDGRRGDGAGQCPRLPSVIPRSLLPGIGTPEFDRQSLQEVSEKLVTALFKMLVRSVSEQGAQFRF